MSQRFEGKNLDDALTNASQTLGVERHQLTYHVLLQKRGFLGGVKRIVIEAEINEAAVAPPPQAAPAAAPSVSAPSGPPRRERPSRGGGGGGGRGGRGRRDNRGGGGGGNRGRRRPHDDDDELALQPGDFEEHIDVEVPEQGAESDTA